VDWDQVLPKAILDVFANGEQITSVALNPADHKQIVIESNTFSGTTLIAAGDNW
jgi:hypothetical protein